MKTYLQKIYQLSKPWFYLLVAFLTIQAFVTYSEYEITPFLNWGMYSQSNSGRDTLSTYILKVNGDEYKEIWDLNDLQRECLLTPMAYYCKLLEREFNDPLRSFYCDKLSLPSCNLLTNQGNTDIDFKKWYRNRLEKYVDVPIDKIEFIKIRAFYNKGKPMRLEEKTILQF